MTLPVQVDPQFDGVIFHFRFLESLSNVWWLAQAMDLTGIDGWCRWQLIQTHRELRMLKQTDGSRDQQVQTILPQRSRIIYRARFTLLISRSVFTMHEIVSLGRAKLNEVFGKIISDRRKRPSGPRSLPTSEADERVVIDDSETLQRRPPV